MARRHAAVLSLAHDHRRVETLAFWDPHLGPHVALEQARLGPVVLAADPPDAPRRHSITRLQAAIHAHRPLHPPAAPA